MRNLINSCHCYTVTGGNTDTREMGDNFICTKATVRFLPNSASSLALSIFALILLAVALPFPKTNFNLRGWVTTFRDELTLITGWNQTHWYFSACLGLLRRKTLRNHLFLSAITMITLSFLLFVLNVLKTGENHNKWTSRVFFNIFMGPLWLLLLLRFPRLGY